MKITLWNGPEVAYSVSAISQCSKHSTRVVMFEIRRTLQSDGFPDLSRISKYRPYHSVLETFPDILHDTDFFVSWLLIYQPKFCIAGLFTKIACLVLARSFRQSNLGMSRAKGGNNGASFNTVHLHNYYTAVWQWEVNTEMTQVSGTVSMLIHLW